MSIMPAPASFQHPTIEIKRVRPALLDRFGGLPGYKTEWAAAIDLIACIEEPLTIHPLDGSVLIPTGIAVNMGRPDMVGLMFPRSSTGHKRALVLGNGTGVIDPDYQGEIMISLCSRLPSVKRTVPGRLGRWLLGICPHAKFQADAQIDDNRVTVVEPGERLAQLVFLPIIRPVFEEVQEFGLSSARGAGGFGSTGR